MRSPRGAIFTMSVALLLSAALGAAAPVAVEPVVADVRRALYCVAHGEGGYFHYLIHRRRRLLVSAYEESSSRGRATHLVLILHVNPRPLMLDFTQQAGRFGHVVTLDNNADFTIGKGEVVFRNPPLGGIWTQD